MFTPLWGPKPFIPSGRRGGRSTRIGRRPRIHDESGRLIEHQPADQGRTVWSTAQGRSTAGVVRLQPCDARACLSPEVIARNGTGYVAASSDGKGQQGSDLAQIEWKR